LSDVDAHNAGIAAPIGFGYGRGNYHDRAADSMHAVVVKVTITPWFMVLDGPPVTGHGRDTDPTGRTSPRRAAGESRGIKGVWSPES
jgi:hypothetical protein